MLNTTNLLSQKLTAMNVTMPPRPQQPQAQNTVSANPAMHSNLLSAYLNTLAMINTAAVRQAAKPAPVAYKNDLRSLMTNNKAVILAMIPRIFNAKDLNGDDKISGSEERGTFLNAIAR